MPRKYQSRALFAALLTSTALAGASPAGADSIVWRGGFDTGYAQVANWESISGSFTDRVPTGTDTAFITDHTASFQPTIGLGQTFSNRLVVVGAAGGTAPVLTVNGTLGLGDPGSAGTLNIAAGSGFPANGVGTVVISGAGASIGAAADAFGGGNPVLNIAEVLGSNGTLRIENGGSGTFATLCLACGNSAFAGTGVVEVTGEGATLDITSGAAVIRIGEASGTGGTGTLNVLNGGTVTMAGGVGDILGVGSTILVRGVDGNGDPSQLTWNGSLTAHGSVSVTDAAIMDIGVLSNLTDTGELSVTGGAQVNQITGEIGNWTFSQQAAVLIDGAGTELNTNGALSISSSNIGAGSADFVISNGAVVSVNSASQSGLASGEERFLIVNDATLNMTGGLLMNAGHLSATNATLNFGSGTVQMASSFNGNTLSLFNADITAAQISTGGTGSFNVINLGGTASGPAGAVGAFNVGAVGLTGGSGAEFVLNHTATNYDIASAFSSIGSAGGIIRHVAGDTIFSGNSNTYNGQTILTGGTLRVNGSLGNGLHVLDVSSGATLGGSGSIGGTVNATDGRIAPGNSPGTLTIVGDLFLGSASVLDFELGSPSGTAGVDSDLINLSGDLILDGTLNVIDAGGFGAGLYRLISFGGDITDNGLDIGTAPAGFNASNLTVQITDTNDGDVNLLVGTPIATISGFMWDGANATANNAVNGGAGTWTETGTNWTIADGSANAAYDENLLLIFTGTPGVVTVDDSLGSVELNAGVQFAVDGYSVTGEDLRLDSANAFRVGDGTAAGASFIATISSSLTGTGSLEKTDLGTLILNGANTYAGDTGVTNGRLIVNGSLVSPNNFVRSGATLGGTGSLAGMTTIDSGGTIAPGNSIGTLNVVNITMAAGSTYTVELNDAGFIAGTNNDLINATGAATINGGTVHVTPENGTDTGATYTPGTYTILTATGGVTGSFGGVTDNYAFLDFSLTYDPTNVFLTSVLASPASPCGSLALTSNQSATCGGVFSVGSGSLFNAVLNLSNAEAPVALDQLSGEIHASAKTALLEDSRFPREAALERLRVALGGAEPRTGQAERKTPEGTNFWAQGIGSWSQWNGDGNAANMSRNIGGLFMGADGEVMDDVHLGLMGGYSRSGVSVSDRMSSGTVDSYTLGAYARTVTNSVLRVMMMEEGVLSHGHIETGFGSVAW